jgi:hypothetical protein
MVDGKSGIFSWRLRAGSVSGNTNGNVAKMLASMPRIVQNEKGEIQFTDWNCQAGQNNVIIRTDGTVAPCFPT